MRRPAGSACSANPSSSIELDPASLASLESLCLSAAVLSGVA
jgi:hypothetical protein